ncbi:bacillithiol system redox-active protein YtxJ [Fulvivirga lutea]|uniref:Bacillithiol system redox-active protein YtxJ n=1 Tax=Fulvivirga lutea TaxID=2810512 RepID=A0A974WGJ3_9BACT|nr:bacillithiol system redox-active protein YtxJ [Fulvivirga lutea]QSE97891.1 bacillithiol system redox-active protein YtxJ [Fulvivirga lutea]
MNWNHLTSEDQLKAAINESEETPVLIFKHSTRCSISSMALNRLERSWSESEGIKPYYLDLIQFRSLSNQIASQLNVEHQSPQAILIKNKAVVHHSSHMGISYSDISKSVIA